MTTNILLNPTVSNSSFNAYTFCSILFEDILPTTFWNVLPNAVSWLYRSLTCEISSHCIQRPNTTSKTAHLFLHGSINKNANVSAVLLLHGEHSHPFSMLHLADIAAQEGRTVFSISLPYNDKKSQEHQELLHHSIDQIKNIIASKGGSLSDLLLAGHSRGAIEAAYERYVRNNSDINGVISIAGRFQDNENSIHPCRATLKPTIDALSGKIEGELPCPFYQIGAKNDWCIGIDDAVVRKDLDYRIVEAQHLNVLYHPDTKKQFKQWIRV